MEIITKETEMNQKIQPSFLIKMIVVLCLLVGILLIVNVALAHETITVGDYAVEYGWINEPAVVGQPNAVVINITSNISQTNSTSSEIDTSGLQISAVFGPQTKVLSLQPLGENTPGQYIAPMTPMLPGVYTIHLGGNIGTTTFNTDVQPEEVKTADVVQFPASDPAQAASSSSGLGLAGWLGIAGIVLGAFGTILGLLSFTRKPTQK
jgi:hypothetical protein